MDSDLQKKYGVNGESFGDSESFQLLKEYYEKPTRDLAKKVWANQGARNFLVAGVQAEVQESERENVINALKNGDISEGLKGALKPVFSPNGVSLEGISSAYDLGQAREAALKKQDDLKERSSQAIEKFATIIEKIYNSWH